MNIIMLTVLIGFEINILELIVSFDFEINMRENCEYTKSSKFETTLVIIIIFISFVQIVNLQISLKISNELVRNIRGLITLS